MARVDDGWMYEVVCVNYGLVRRRVDGERTHGCGLGDKNHRQTDVRLMCSCLPFARSFLGCVKTLGSSGACLVLCVLTSPPPPPPPSLSFSRCFRNANAPFVLTHRWLNVPPPFIAWLEAEADHRTKLDQRNDESGSGGGSDSGGAGGQYGDQGGSDGGGGGDESIDDWLVDG